MEYFKEVMSIDLSDIDENPLTGLYDRAHLYASELSTITLQKMSLMDVGGVSKVSIFCVQYEADVSELILRLKRENRSPLTLGQLFPLAYEINFKFLYSIMALGSAKVHDVRLGTALVTVPYVFLAKTIEYCESEETKISKTDKRYADIIQAIRGGRYFACDFKNIYNTKNTFVAVAG